MWHMGEGSGAPKKDVKNQHREEQSYAGHTVGEGGAATRIAKRKLWVARRALLGFA